MKKEISSEEFVSEINNRVKFIQKIFGVLVLLLLFVNIIGLSIDNSAYFQTLREGINRFFIPSAGFFVWLKWVQYKKGAKWSVVTGLLISIVVTIILIAVFVEIDTKKSGQVFQERLTECNNNSIPLDRCFEEDM